MFLKDLQFEYPENLVAIKPQSLNPERSRVMFADGRDNLEADPEELTIEQLLSKIPRGDVLVINNTRVLKRRIFAQTENENLEILFLDRESNQNFNYGIYQVMFPSKKFKIGDQIKMPNGAVMTLLEKGLPQKVKVDPDFTEEDFMKYGELPLPPYIQKARNERHNHDQDESWYQTKWAKKPGSYAAPTASLHFTQEELVQLKARGVQVLEITLHVGLGTFLPVKVQDLNDHKMHSEFYSVPEEVWEEILLAKKMKHKIWCLGTTVTRTLESVARSNQLTGHSDLLLQVGSEFKIVDVLMTNFHQPESTLLALVAGFAGLERVKKNYQWAIDRKFKLFSYGDLSVWMKSVAQK